MLADVSRHFFQFKLPDGQIKFRTLAGGLVTIALTILVLSYAMSEFIVVWNRTNYNIIEKSDENALSYQTHSFGKDEGFAIAAAVVNDHDESIYDPEIGQLKFLIKSWESSTEELKFTDLA